jgi:Mg-chelatase subunit ChlD
MADTTDLELAEFAENPEPRCPCVLLLDTSGSMQGDPIKALNQGLQAFKDDLMRDPLASRRVELAVVTGRGHPLSGTRKTWVAPSAPGSSVWDLGRAWESLS